MIRLEQKMVAEARLPLREMVAGIPTLLTDVAESRKADCNEERTRYYAGDDPFKIDRVGVCCAVVVITNCGGFATFYLGEIVHVCLLSLKSGGETEQPLPGVDVSPVGLVNRNDRLFTVKPCPYEPNRLAIELVGSFCKS